MVKLTEFGNTTASALEAEPVTEDLRPYLGMSILGHPCSRYLWYSFRWCYSETHSRRLRRLFDRGHREEPSVIADLERIGMVVNDAQEEVEAAWGHVKGHCDGKVKGVVEAPNTEHLLEIKTASDKMFKDMQNNRCEVAKPVYYAQCQLYMHHLKLSRALFVMVNKNDDAYYIERIYYDKMKAEQLAAKGEKIILSAAPPAPAFSRSHFECKWCSCNDICHHGRKVAMTNCRTCMRSGPTPTGGWKCGLDDRRLTEEAQRKGCKDHSLMVELGGNEDNL